MTTQTLKTQVRPDGFSLSMEHIFNHPRPRVFEAWTKPEALRRWMGPAGFTCEGAEADVRPGGRYRFPMIDSSGQVHTVQGTYIEVSPVKRLTFTWVWDDSEEESCGLETLVTLEFLVEGKGTRLVIHHEGLASAHARDCHHDGWVGCKASLEAYLNQASA